MRYMGKSWAEVLAERRGLPKETLLGLLHDGCVIRTLELMTGVPASEKEINQRLGQLDERGVTFIGDCARVRELVGKIIDSGSPMGRELERREARFELMSLREIEEAQNRGGRVAAIYPGHMCEIRIKEGSIISSSDGGEVIGLVSRGGEKRKARCLVLEP